MSKAEGKRIIIKFTEPITSDVLGNEDAFTVTGKEYKWVDGPDYNGLLIDKNYQVVSVDSHPTLDDKHIRLTLSDNSRFNSVVGDLTVGYDQTLGSLSGNGGVVASFAETFIPNDLVEQGNPRVREYISTSISGSIDFIELEKINAYSEKEYITANISGTVELINIDDLNQ